MEVIAHKISKKSLFKLMLTGAACGFFIFFVLCGIAAFFGADTVTWDGESVTGLSGLLLSLAMWPFFSLFFTLFLGVFITFGLWIFSFFKPLKVTFKGVLNEGE